MSDQLINIVKNQFLGSKKSCLVIGDLMLDQYIFGDVDRISPEAPVPVIKKNKHHNRIGGAGNVALNLSALGCKVSIMGVIGEDNDGQHCHDRAHPDCNLEPQAGGNAGREKPA